MSKVEVTRLLVQAARNWFDGMSEQKKRQYVKLHPDSKYARSFRPSNLKAGKNWSAHARITDPEHHRKHAKHHAIASHFLGEKLKGTRGKADRDEILEQISNRNKWKEKHLKMFKKLGGIELGDGKSLVNSHMRQFRRNPSKENPGEQIVPPMSEDFYSVGDKAGKFRMQPNMSLNDFQMRASSRLGIPDLSVSARGDANNNTDSVSLTNGYTQSQKESPRTYMFQKSPDKGHGQLESPLPISVRESMGLYSDKE
jgi:hypothetical protein